jgi:alkyl sulfatase BDS1-like metallo-beta-lactamase superfamily hydrolase
VFNQYLGWFGGDPAALQPLPPTEYAKRMQNLAGGGARLLDTAREALCENDPQWALHCAQAVLRANEDGILSAAGSLHQQAKVVAIEALEALAATQVSANGRNYYLTYARELEGSLKPRPSPRQIEAACKELGAIEILLMLPLRLKAENVQDLTGKVSIFIQCVAL